jgi:Fe-S-cluster containining protein
MVLDIAQPEFAPGLGPKVRDAVTIAHALSGLRKVHSLFDAARAEVEMATGVPLCVPECGLCCANNTPCSWELEAAHAVSLLYGNASLYRAIRERSLNWLRSQRNLNSGQGIAAASKGPCPFMSTTKGCLIYEGRPLACHAYGVTRAPANYCKREMGRGELPNTRAIYGGEGEAELRQAVDDLYHRIKDNRLGAYTFFPILILVEMGQKVGPVPVAKIPLGMLWQDQVDNINQGSITPLARDRVE